MPQSDVLRSIASSNALCAILLKPPDSVLIAIEPSGAFLSLPIALLRSM